MDNFKSALEAAGFTVTKISHRQMKLERKRKTVRDWDLTLKGERKEVYYGRHSKNTKGSPD